MKIKTIFFLIGLTFVNFSKAGFSIDDAERFYSLGQYRDAKRILNTDSVKQTERAQVLLLAMGDYDHVLIQTPGSQPSDSSQTPDEHSPTLSGDTINRIQKIVQNASSLKDPTNPERSRGLIIKARWNLSEVSNDFPIPYDTLWAGPKQVSKGKEILEQLLMEENKHAAFALGSFYLRPDIQDQHIRSKGNEYWKLAANFSHIDARTELTQFGINWQDREQFGDHCSAWCFIPNCDGASSCNQKIRSCVGFGPSSKKNGWVDCNCLIAGCATELNCRDIAQHATNGFLSCLRAVYFPMKLAAALTAGAATATSAAGLAGPGIILAAVTTGLTTAITFTNSAEEESNGASTANVTSSRMQI